METIGATEFYDRLARAFDVMTDWPGRLNHEMPFLENILRRHRAQTVLDTACGTGWHSLALSERGFTAMGCDVSPAMIERARANSARSHADVQFEIAGFSQLHDLPGKFDALLCLGNSLPHLLSPEALIETFRQMREKLNPQGVLILHNLNYDLRLQTRPRFFAAEGNEKMIVWRFADYGPELITFHTALFERSDAPSPKWSVQVNSTPQRPWLAKDLDRALGETGFQTLEHFGGLDGSPYVPEKSGDLVIVATFG